MEFLSDITYWHWLIFGLALMVLEILLPSAVFLWPGIAGVLVGSLSFVAPSLSNTILIFAWAILSVAFAFGWKLYRKNHPETTPIPTMNKRGSEYVGRHYTLAKDIVNGVGELNVSDTRWKVVCNEDIAAGSKVKVIAVEDTSLRVEKFLG